MTGKIWQPYTQMKTAGVSRHVSKASGAYLELEDGSKILDLISSWWTNLHGHCHPHIVKAISAQAGQLEHVIFSGFTHSPAENLSRRLVSHLPAGLNNVFFSDDGSTAVEVALKMALQFWFNVGSPSRNKFIAFSGGYHGDTFGAMALGATSGFFASSQANAVPVQFVPYPQNTLHGENQAELESESLHKLSELIEAFPDQFAALIIEPLVQGASGMRMCSINFMQNVERICKSAGILLIYDEVMTGFGRTGDWFASSRSCTTPDIICLSKGITGGFLPLAATVTTDSIFNSFLSHEPRQMFAHGHSYTANPLACAAACASLDLLEENPGQFQRLGLLHQYLMDSYWSDHPDLVNHRICGTIAAVDLKSHGQDDYFNSVAGVLRERFVSEGFLIRPLGKVIYFMPPYCIEDTALEDAYKKVAQVVSELSASSGGK